MRLSFVLATLLVLICSGLAAAQAPPPGGTNPNAIWAAGMTIMNNTKYDLIYEGFDGKNIDEWRARPPAKIPRGAESGPIMWLDTTFGGGTFGTVTYGVFLPNRTDPASRLGSVKYTVQIDCILACRDYTRRTEGQSSLSELRLSWSDNDGHPGNPGYFGRLVVTMASPIGAEPFWRSCPARGLGAAHANVLAHGVSCAAVRKAIGRGGSVDDAEWATPGWRCDVAPPRMSRIQVTCGRGDGRLRFDLD